MANTRLWFLDKRGVLRRHNGDESSDLVFVDLPDQAGSSYERAPPRRMKVAGQPNAVNDRMNRRMPTLWS